MASIARGPAASGITVYLNVYDLWEHNEYIHAFGLGAYHSGVQVGNREYSFAGGAGIFMSTPKTAPAAVFRESIEMGVFAGSMSQIERVVDSLNSQFAGDMYNIVSKNCNHFADAFCMQLVGRGIPAYVNRLAAIGSYFECFIPPEMSGQAPVQPDGSAGSGSSSSTGVQMFAPANAQKVVQRRSATAFQGTPLRTSQSSGSITTSETSSSISEQDKKELMRQAALARYAK